MKNRLTKTITFLSLIFILTLSVFSFAFTSSTTTVNDGKLYTPPFSIYFVATAKSQLESEASSLAKDTMANGCGGYVWKNENYFYAISSAYENKNDATLMSNSLENKNIKNEIFCIDFPAKNVLTEFEKKEEKSLFLTATYSFYSSFKTLFDISVCLDTNLYDEEKAMLEISNLQRTIDEIMKNFDSIFGDCDLEILSHLNNATVDQSETIGQLSAKQFITEKQSLLSLIRYSYTKIIAIFHNFLEKI